MITNGEHEAARSGVPWPGDRRAGAPLVTVYWRPGCPYCRRLRGDLRRIGLPVQEVNIWDDPSAAALVRSVAGGNETVPTVLVGGKALVNPSASTVVAEVRRADPAIAADGALERAARGVRLLRAARWVLLAGLIAASYAIGASGHPGLSWALDGAAVAVWAAAYAGFRLVRQRKQRSSPGRSA